MEFELRTLLSKVSVEAALSSASNSRDREELGLERIRRYCREVSDMLSAVSPNYGQNYEPNTRHWPVGALVIHDADAKKPEMLMRVTGYEEDGQARTVYIDPTARWASKPWVNDIRYLHDPRIFGIEAPE